jgi:hypothetical protein
MDIILSLLPNSVPEYNVLELNTNLEGLLATISTFSTNIMTMPALEKAINEWVLDVSNEKAMHTVGGNVIVRTKIIARGTSGDDIIHLKTSYIKFKVIL